MILLDTNVVSETMRKEPSASVMGWLARQPSTSLFLPAVVEAELRYGAAILPQGGRRDALVAAIDVALRDGFDGRFVAFDRSAAVAYAAIAAERRRLGRPIAALDAQIAAIARSRGATLATRNVADFEACGVALVDPWSACA